MTGQVPCSVFFLSVSPLVASHKVYKLISFILFLNTMKASELGIKLGTVLHEIEEAIGNLLVIQLPTADRW
jgi:uncharacterized membrane protein